MASTRLRRLPDEFRDAPRSFDGIPDLLASFCDVHPSGIYFDFPSSNAFLVRWQQTRSQSIYSPPVQRDFAVVSLMLRPMAVKAWLREDLVWEGPISANSVRVIDAVDVALWTTAWEFDFIHLFIPQDTIAGMIKG